MDIDIELILNDNFTNFTYGLSSLHISILSNYPHLTYCMLSLYSVIFIIGVLGNILVIHIVFCNDSMKTITNRFIACMSLSDLLICFFGIPFTPINALMTSWIFGNALCKLVPMIQLISVFVSTLTSVVIALDRYMVIVHPHTPRMTAKVQAIVLVFIWVMAGSTAVPIGIYTSVEKGNKDEGGQCYERWPNTRTADIYTWIIFSLQLVVPAIIISICYSRVSIELHKRTMSRVGQRDYHRLRMQEKRNRRINRMFIAMITIFVLCWLPLDVFHLRLISQFIPNSYHLIVFLFLHLIAMSSVIYNPFLYGWMNENFNRHFKELWYKLRCTRQLKEDNNDNNNNYKTGEYFNGSTQNTRFKTSEEVTLLRKYEPS